MLKRKLSEFVNRIKSLYYNTPQNLDNDKVARKKVLTSCKKMVL